MSLQWAVMRLWLHASATSTRSPSRRPLSAFIPSTNVCSLPPLWRLIIAMLYVVNGTVGDPRSSSVQGCTMSTAWESVTISLGPLWLSTGWRARSKRARSVATTVGSLLRAWSRFMR
eukprot:5974671-Pyramimonas_sp.AAC.1